MNSLADYRNRFAPSRRNGKLKAVGLLIPLFDFTLLELVANDAIAASHPHRLLNEESEHSLIDLNKKANQLFQDAVRDAEELNVNVRSLDDSTTLIDMGVETAGSLAAGLRMAEICMSGLGRVRIAPGFADSIARTRIQVETAQPLLACMASQYAGLPVSTDSFFCNVQWRHSRRNWRGKSNRTLPAETAERSWCRRFRRRYVARRFRDPPFCGKNADRVSNNFQFARRRPRALPPQSQIVARSVETAAA